MGQNFNCQLRNDTVFFCYYSSDLRSAKFTEKFFERFLEKCEIFGHGPNYVQKLYQKQLNAS